MTWPLEQSRRDQDQKGITLLAPTEQIHDDYDGSPKLSITELDPKLTVIPDIVVTTVAAVEAHEPGQTPWSYQRYETKSERTELSQLNYSFDERNELPTDAHRSGHWWS